MVMAKLEGMKAICRFTGRSESTIMSMIQTMDFPATRGNGNVWESTTEAVEKWRDGRDEPKPVKKKKRRSKK
jgi:predicted DNA-binding transcriptional regulator AlpA